MGGKGNSGVAAQIKNLEGAIGYLNYGYVNGGKFQQVALQNKAGNFVKANADTSAAGLVQIILDDKLWEQIQILQVRMLIPSYL